MWNSILIKAAQITISSIAWINRLWQYRCDVNLWAALEIRDFWANGVNEAFQVMDLTAFCVQNWRFSYYYIIVNSVKEICRDARGGVCILWLVFRWWRVWEKRSFWKRLLSRRHISVLKIITNVYLYRGKVVHTYSVERGCWSGEKEHTRMTQYMMYARSLCSNHVPQFCRFSGGLIK
jgi:hypothetical protein